MKLKILAGIVGALLVAAVGAWWWYSPYLELQALQNAVKTNDLVSFNEHVDYDRLKESIKQQVTTALMPIVGQQVDAKGKDPLVAAGETIGAGLGMLLIEPMVNALVTPEVLMAAVRRGRLDGSPTSGSGAASAALGQAATAVRWQVERKGANTAVLHDDGVQPMTLIFTRSGFAAWKLSAVQLPPDQLK